MANFSFGGGKKLLTAADFMPSQRERLDREASEKPERLNRKKTAARIRAFFLAAIERQNRDKANAHGSEASPGT